MARSRQQKKKKGLEEKTNITSSKKKETAHATNLFSKRSSVSGEALFKQKRARSPAQALAIEYMLRNPTKT